MSNYAVDIPCGRRIPELFLTALRVNSAIRPCQDFKPEHFIGVRETLEGWECYIPPESKKLWFYAYCKENGFTGRLTVSCDDLQLSSSGASINGFGYIRASAQVAIDDSVIATGCYGRNFAIGDQMPEGIIQDTCEAALALALENAGFGAVPAQALEAYDTENAETSESANLPTVAPATIEEVSEEITAKPSDQDEISRVREILCPTGVDKGRTLGEMLDDHRYQSLRYLAEKWKGNGHPAQGGAKLLLEHLQNGREV